jgi:hypothetical protein
MLEAIKNLDKRYTVLYNDRASWYTHWQDLNRYYMPRNGQFLQANQDRGERQHNDIIDDTGTQALKTSSSGLINDMASPSRPWFALEIADRDLMKYKPVKVWLDDVRTIMLDIFARSNFYRVLRNIGVEAMCYGTTSAFVADDFNKVIHLHPYTIGEYCLAQNFRGEVDTIYREFKKPVGQLIREFGKQNCSQQVVRMYEQGALDNMITIRHTIEPREIRDYGSKSAKDMPFKSCYWEVGNHDGKYLRESGFKSFPILAPRWDAFGQDVYGSSPGMDALGAVIQLQVQNLRKSQAIDYMANPPLQLPISMKDRDSETFPGGRSYVDMTAGAAGGIRTAFDVRLDIVGLMNDIQDIRQRIRNTFFTDLFKMISDIETGQHTAYEIATRNQEKITILGPVVERFNNELLDPAVSIVFERGIAGNIFPPPPQELGGQSIQVEYSSIIAEAAQSMELNGINRLVAGIGQIATMKPDVLDKFDSDQWADIYADRLGTDPDLIVSGEQVALIRQERVKAQQIQAQQQAMMGAADMAGKVGNIPNEGTLGADIIKKVMNG